MTTPISFIDPLYLATAYVEGGDIVQIDDHVYLIGYGNGRTTLRGAELMRKLMLNVLGDQGHVFLVPLKPDTKWYHLDMCLFASPLFLIVADHLHEIFEEAGISVLHALWDTIIVLSRDFPAQSSMWHEFACNAVRVNKRIITTVQWPRQLQDIIRQVDSDAEFICAFPTEIMFGGGGVASTLLINKNVAISVNPSKCNLHRYRLNEMAKKQHATTYGPDGNYNIPFHQRELCNDMDRIRMCLEGFTHLTLESNDRVKECVHVKDMGILLYDDVHKTHVFIMGRMRAQERADEKAWFLENMPKVQYPCVNSNAILFNEPRR